MKLNMFLLMALLSATSVANAEVYRWVDDNGKVHFSDKKPSAKPADNITQSVGKTNIDQSSQESRKLEKLFARETEAEKQLRMQQREQERAHREKVNAECEKARKTLKKFEGPVYFVDKDGKSYDVSLEEKKRREEALRRKITRHCN